MPEDPNLVSLKNLLHIDLYDNLISRIPTCLANLTQLTTLNLSFNLIENVPAGSLPKYLKYLYLTSNRLADVPVDAVKQLEILAVLELGANKISSFPSALCLSELEELWLSSNHLTNEEMLDFSNLRKLKILSLQCNKLCGSICLSSDSLLLPESIEELYLAENSIEVFEIEQKAIFPKLRILDLSYNQIGKLSRSVSLNCPLLTDIWINDNQISSLEQTLNVVQNIPKLSSLFLTRNPCSKIPSTYQVKVRLACPKLSTLDGQPF